MTDSLPPCPECSSDLTYEDGQLLACPLCGHEWEPLGSLDGEGDGEDDGPVIRDSVGNVLSDGDTVTVVKDLKIKGSSSVIKIGTKVSNIRLVDGVGDHDLDCRVPGVGPMQLKSSVVKKA